MFCLPAGIRLYLSTSHSTSLLGSLLKGSLNMATGIRNMSLLEPSDWYVLEPSKFHSGRSGWGEKINLIIYFKILKNITCGCWSFQSHIPSTALGSESKVLVLQRSPSPDPSIQMYKAWTLPPWGRSMYCCLTALFSFELAEVAMFLTLETYTEKRTRDEPHTGEFIYFTVRWCVHDKYWHNYIMTIEIIQRQHNNAISDQATTCLLYWLFHNNSYDSQLNTH